MQTLRVRDVMSRRVQTIAAHETVSVPGLVRRFRRFHHLPVVDTHHRAVGMLTPDDVLQYAAQPRERGVKVAELMRAPPLSIAELAPLETAARTMTDEGVRALVVVSPPANALAGIVTSSDLLRALAGAAAAPESLAELPVDELMTAEPVTLPSDATVADAARVLAETGARHVPVVDANRKLVGVVSERDLVGHLRADVMAWPDAAVERLDEPVSSLMTPEPTALYSGTRVRDAYAAFAEERLAAVPVVDDAGRLLGILSYVDVLRWLKDRSTTGGPPAPSPAPAWSIEAP